MSQSYVLASDCQPSQKILIRYIRWLVIPVVALVYLLFRVKDLVIDGDTFWAIKIGEWIADHGAVPTQDTFSWTVNGHPWVAHEWLYDLLIYRLYSAFGFMGVFFTVFIAFSATIFILWALYRAENKNTPQTIKIFLAFFLMMGFFIVARPHIFSFAFFTYYLYVLLSNRKLLWSLPFVAVLWANIHGSVLLGIAMVILQFVFELVYSLATERKPFVDKGIMAVSVLVPLFSLINPYGLELWKAAFWLITSDINHQIIEWQPPNFTNKGFLLLYMVVVISAFLACYFRREYTDKKRLYLLAIYLIGTFYEAVTGIRYFPYLAICWGVFVLALLPDNLLTMEWNKKVLGLVSMAILTYLAVSIHFPSRLEDAIDKQKWPLEAVNHLEQLNTFNDYGWGGYLVYKGIPVFVDGRADIYQKDSEVFKDYVDAIRINKDPEKILDKYKIEQVIIPVNTPMDIFLKQGRWVERYRDEVTVIYQKR